MCIPYVGMYNLELSDWPLDMFLHISEGTFTQILESQQWLSKKLKNGKNLKFCIEIR